MVKILPATAGEVRETWVSSLGQEDPLEDGITIHSIILACRIPWTEEPGRLQSIESHRSDLSQYVISYGVCHSPSDALHQYDHL